MSDWLGGAATTPNHSDTVLLVMDMQTGFAAACDGITIWFVKQEILRAIELNMPVVILEYDVDDFGATHREIMELLSGYPRLAVIGRAPRRRGQAEHERDNGAAEVVEACLEHNFHPEGFRVCGVNSDACVVRTIRGLVSSLPTCLITVVQDACNSTNGRNTHVFQDVFPQMPNVSVLEHGATVH